SVSTVSRVIAGHPDVSPSTAAAVQEIIDRRHFSVNRAARSLKQTATMTILVMIKGRNNMLFASMLEHVQEAVTPTGFTVTAQYIDEDANEVAEAEKLISEIKPRGVIFLGGEADHFGSHAHRIGEDCPAVVLTNSVASAGIPGVSCVTTNDFLGAQAATQYLFDHGHRRIGVIGGNPEVSIISMHRRQGVIAAARSYGVDFDPESAYVESRFSMKSGYESAMSLLDSVPGLTAIYAMSDMMAVGAIRALKDRGLEVPRDTSIIGHDGIEWASYMVPKLVTIRQPQEKMAARGVEILLGHIVGDLDPKEEILDIEILDGESVRSLTAK
ncbi:MAG: LacI family transcriptional regulator, partial [Propionibacteriaceae bacterium]|nr:LacI family transcriptional regulator [Propionibacteriaceae bacterium]